MLVDLYLQAQEFDNQTSQIQCSQYLFFACQFHNNYWQLQKMINQEHLDAFPFPYDYVIHDVELLGAGSYGKVFRSISKKTGHPVAIKQMNMAKIREENLQEALKIEIQTMRELKSQNTVQMIDAHIGPVYTYIILQLCDTDLRKKMISSPVRFSQQQCIRIFQGIMKGFRVLVQNSYIHRDIKPENILIKNDVMKIADFGFARKADMLCEQKYQQMCGTPIYMSPQILNKQKYNSKCDIWSLALILYELIYGTTPWPVRYIQTYLEAIKTRPLSFPFDVKIGKETKDFLKKALVVEEQKRMNWEEVYNHPLIKNRIAGDLCLTKAVQPKIRMILGKIQQEAQLKHVNQIQIFKKYSKYKNMSFVEFEGLLKQLNPTISSYEIKVLFSACDENSDGFIEEAEFEEMFCSTNYKLDPEIERQIDEITAIIRGKRIDIYQLFKRFDKNKTGALDSNQFKDLILSIAPKYSLVQIRKIYKKLDSNNTGLIQINELVKAIGTGLVSQKNYVGILRDRAARNLNVLKIHLSSVHLTPQQFLALGDINHDQHIDEGEFESLMGRIKFIISKEEIRQIFELIDQNRSGKVSLLEIMGYLK